MLSFSTQIPTMQAVASFYLSKMPKPKTSPNQKCFYESMCKERMRQIWAVCLESPNVDESTKLSIREINKTYSGKE